MTRPITSIDDSTLFEKLNFIEREFKRSELAIQLENKLKELSK